jgi:hypothetical protein
VAADGHNTQEGMMQRTQHKAEQLTTTRGQSQADRRNQSTAPSKANRNNQGEGKADPTTGQQTKTDHNKTWKQSKADREIQKAKVQARAKQPTAVQVRPQQPTGNSQQITTTGKRSWQLKTSQI